MKNEIKIIFHIDLNAFFCSCAIIKDPYLKDKAFVVGGNAQSKRGVVSTSSYPARKLGIHSAMNISDALNIYPKLLIIPSDFKHYQKMSNLFFSHLRQYSSLVLEGSIDEAFIDMTEASQKTHPLELAKKIQDELMTKYQLPSSIGIAPTLFLAKMASDMKKPLGITVLRKKDIVHKLFPLPIQAMYGIGKKTYPLLMMKNIHTIGDFSKNENKSKILDVMSEQSYLGYMDNILGRSSNLVDPKLYEIPKSVSNETTLNYIMDEEDAVFDIIKTLIEKTHERLVQEELVTKTVGIKLKYVNFETINRSHTFEFHTDDLMQIKDQIEQLFDKNYDKEPVRLVGVFFNQVMLKKDLKIDYNLFNYQELTKRETALYKVINEMNEKYPEILKKGTSKSKS
jgi:DNA polymerase IV